MLKLNANGELDEAAVLLDSIASKIEGSQMELVYWHNRAVLEKRYEKQYFLMEKINIYLKMNKMEEALEVEKELKQEKKYPLIDWWLEQQGM